MRFGTQCEQGDIVLVPFPFSNLMNIKKRPVLILSKNSYNNKTRDIITCGITSNINDSDCSVVIDNKDLISGNLPVQSRIKADKLFTLEQSIIIKKLGKVKEFILQNVKEELFKVM